MDKPQQYKQCCEHMANMYPSWYNNLRKHMNGALGVSTEYYDRKTASNVFHLAVPDRDISLLLLDCNEGLNRARNIEGCMLPHVLDGLYQSVRMEYEKNKNK